MAHELAIINGLASMFCREGISPWWETEDMKGHKLPLTALAQIAMMREVLQAANPPACESICFADGTPIADRFAVRRPGASVAYYVASERYRITSEEDVIQIVEPLVLDGTLAPQTGGLLFDGARSWTSFHVADMGSEAVAGSKTMVPSLSLSNSHDGSTRLTAFRHATNIVCANTEAIARGEGYKAKNFIAFRHTEKSTTEAARAELRKYLASYGAEFATWADTRRKLYATRHNGSAALAQDFFAKAVGVEKIENRSKARANSPMEALLVSWESAPGADVYTLGGLVDAVTYWTTHCAKRTAEARFAGAMFGDGNAAGIAAQALAQEWLVKGIPAGL